MYALEPKPLWPRIDEPVRSAGGHDDDLPDSRFDHLLTGEECRAALVYDEDLFVRVAVQLWSGAWLEVDHDEADRDIVGVALEAEVR
jgi:hypothetical protein